MLDNFVYKNHLGQRFDGLSNGVYLNYNDMRDYDWNYDTINSKISRFYRSVKGRKLPLVINCKTDEEAIMVKNQLTDLAESDIEAMLPGKIYIGEYYTVGYITASVKSDYLITKRMCKIELTLTSDDPVWYREQTHVFLPSSGDITNVGEGSDYPYDYKYDYSSTQAGRTIVCDSIRGSAFRLRIYGVAINPTIIISGQKYSINGTINAGESLLIDSLNKTITLTTASGTQINWFAMRNRESYIFKSIPAGQSEVGWDGSFGFDLTVIEKRSEPKWT